VPHKKSSYPRPLVFASASCYLGFSRSFSIDWGFSFLTIPSVLASGDASSRSGSERIIWEYLGIVTVSSPSSAGSDYMAHDHAHEIRKPRLLMCWSYMYLCLPLFSYSIIVNRMILSSRDLLCGDVFRVLSSAQPTRISRKAILRDLFQCLAIPE